MVCCPQDPPDKSISSSKLNWENSGSSCGDDGYGTKLQPRLAIRMQSQYSTDQAPRELDHVCHGYGDTLSCAYVNDPVPLGQHKGLFVSIVLPVKPTKSLVFCVVQNFSLASRLLFELSWRSH